MGSPNKTHIYDPLDLEILDRVYEAAWARFEAAEPNRDLSHDGERQEAVRQLVFTLASGHPVDQDALLEKLEAVPASWFTTMAGELAA